MKPTRTVLAALALMFASQAWSATAPATPTCNSGPQSGWQPTDALKTLLGRQGTKVTKITVAGDCYAVYAVNKANQPVNNYYHPVTLKIVGPIPK
jgi:hypothetical protein